MQESMLATAEIWRQMPSNPALSEKLECIERCLKSDSRAIPFTYANGEYGWIGVSQGLRFALSY